MEELRGGNRMDDCVTVNASQEDLYRVYMYCEEKLQEELIKGTTRSVAEINALTQAMYALREAALQKLPGETAAPPART